MTRPALRAAGALLFLCAVPVFAAQSPTAAPDAMTVRTLPAPVRKPAPPSPAAAALGAALKEITAGRAAGSYVQWLDTLPGLRFSPATTALLTKQFGTARLFSVKREDAAGGARDYVFTAPALRRANPDGSRFAWDTITGQAQVAPDGVTVTSKLDAPRVLVEDKTTRIELRRLTASSTSLDRDLAYGDGAVDIGNLQLTNKADGTVVAIDGLFGKFGITDQGTGVGMAYEAGMRTVAVQGERIDDVHLGMHLNGLDKAALEQLNKLGKQLQAQRARLPAAAPDPHLAAPLLRQMGLALTAKGAAIVFDDVSFSYRGSKARMHGEMHIDNATAADLDQLPVLIKKVTGHAEVELPLAMLRGFTDSVARKQLARQQPGADAATIDKVSQAAYDGALRSAVANGYMRVEGDLLVTTIDIRDGAILLNGKPLQMPTPPAPAPVAAVDSGAGSMRARRIAERCRLPDYPVDVVAKDGALSLALQLTVNEDGSVGRLSVARSSGVAAYDAAVLAAAAHCTYIPALHNGKPVAVSEVWEIIRAPGTARP
jgi:TonB family protein